LGEQRPRNRNVRHRNHADDVQRAVLISAVRGNQRQLSGQVAEGDGSTNAYKTPAQGEKTLGPLLSKFRYGGIWSRSFLFLVAIERKKLQAAYRDGPLTVTSPKANKVSTVIVKVEG
jgi:hypothetical protein